MDLQNFICILIALIWLSGLIWASVIAFKNRGKKMDGMDKYELLRKNREYIQYCNGLLYILYENMDSMYEFRLRMLLNQLKEIHSELSEPALLAERMAERMKK